MYKYLIALVGACSLLPLSAQATDITITAPIGTVNAPVWIRAHNVGCNGKTPVSFGYSIDDQTAYNKGVTNYDIDTVDSSITPGNHTIRFKSWVDGAECPTQLSNIVVQSPPPPPPPSYLLTVTTAGTGTGTVASAPTGTSFTSGTVVTLTATADASSTFTGWSGACSGSSSCTVTMNADTSVTAMFTVIPPPPPPPPSGPTIPGNATQVILDPQNWNQTKDAGTGGTGCTPSLPCSTTYPVTMDATHSPSRSYMMTYANAAGVRWSTTAATGDATSTHFVYDTYVYADDWSNVMNLEMDINQVVAGGSVRILGTQCAGYSKTWEYTLDKPTGGWHWVQSNLSCDPTKWTPSVWHHIQIVGHFDSNDNAYYDEVWFDGVVSTFANASGPVGDPLGWAQGHVVINFQIDGKGASGSATVVANKLTIFRW